MRGRRLLLFVVVFAVALEGLVWLRALGIAALQDVYPAVGATDAGEPLAFEVDRAVHGGTVVEERVELLDARRRVVRALDPRHGDPAWPPAVARRPKTIGEHGPWERFENPEWYETLRPFDATRTWLERLLRELNALQNGGIVGRPRKGLWWEARDGRVVCREAPGDAVVSRLDADFGGVRSMAWSHSTDRSNTTRVRAVGVDPAGRRIVEVAVTASYDRVPREPLPVEVDVRAFHEAPRADDPEVAFAALVEAGGERLLVDETGAVFARAPRPEGEVIVGHGDLVGLVPEEGEGALARMILPHRRRSLGATLTTAPVPVDPVEVRLRFRILPAGGEERVAEVHLRPVTPGERLLAGLVLLPDLARPLPLLAASAASEPPATWEELAGWWARSPALAGGRRPGLFALALLVAMGCAVLARRSARRRCRTNAAVRAWIVAVLLLGPLGLLWMRLCLPRVRLEAVADGTRAAHLDTAPAARAPWPAPEPLGIEVHG